jgi:hypothetical protein
LRTEQVAINGVNYCHAHLQIYCHICELDLSQLHEEVNEEWERMGLRPGGDPRLTGRAKEWMSLIVPKQQEMRLQTEFLASQDVGGTVPPDAWRRLCAERDMVEGKVNDGFMAKLQQTLDEGVSQCCYWACETPRSEKLFKCGGCGLVKYCSKGHQRLDWL